MLENNRIYYRINGWDRHFETAKSRHIGHKSWGVYPLKHGSGYCRMMSKKNGASVYGVFIAMCSIVHQKPKETRQGYLTDTGGIPGYSYDEKDISAMTRITLSVIRNAIKELILIRWLTPCDSTGKETEGYREDTARILRAPCTDSTDSTDSTEGTEEFEKFWNIYDKKKDKDRALDYWLGKTIIKSGKRINDTDRENIMLIVADYIKSTPDKQFRKDPSTYLYNSAWKDEIIAEQKKNGRKKLTNDRDVSQYSHLVEGPES